MAPCICASVSVALDLTELVRSPIWEAALSGITLENILEDVVQAANQTNSHTYHRAFNTNPDIA